MRALAQRQRSRRRSPARQARVVLPVCALVLNSGYAAGWVESRCASHATLNWNCVRGDRACALAERAALARHKEVVGEAGNVAMPYVRGVYGRVRVARPV